MGGAIDLILCSESKIWSFFLGIRGPCGINLVQKLGAWSSLYALNIMNSGGDMVNEFHALLFLSKKIA
jgi:hypothetical protein